MFDGIIRMPRFTRNEVMFHTQLLLAEQYKNKLIFEDLSEETRFEFTRLWMSTLDSAAKYGGFLTVTDLLRWLDKHPCYV